MKNRKMLLPVLLSIALVSGLILPASMPNMAPVMAQGQVTPMVAADTTVSVGNYYPLECDVSSWTDIIQVAAGGYHTVGLKTDGTVIAVGYNHEGQCNVGNWTDIIQVAVGYSHTVGRKTDGTVVAVGRNYDGRCDVGNWTGITQVAAGEKHTVGLKSDGTVVAVGDNYDGQCNVGGWKDITQVTAGGHHTVGLKSDGTVVAVGSNSFGQCDVRGWIRGWKDITQVDAGSVHTVGLKSDGTVVIVGNCGSPLFPTHGCFIATAAYGTPMAGEIEILRQFRDGYLLANPLGQALVGLYYRVSPPIAEFITEHPALKPIVRVGLVPAVAVSAVAVNTTPAEKTAILGLLVLVSVALAVWATGRRGRGPERT